MRIELWGLIVFASLFVLSVTVQAADTPEAGKPLRVLILSGANNHDWKTTTPALKKILEGSGRFSVEVTENPAECTADRLANVDVIVSNWTAWPDVEGRPWGPDAEKAFLDFVRNGKGVAFFHASSAALHTWPEFQQIVGATWELNVTAHGSYHAFPVVIADPDHPVTHGMQNFAIKDELWHRMKAQPNIHVLAKAFSSKESSGTGEWEPVAICTEFGKGRGFYTALGHDAAAMQNVAWQALMARGVEWAATGKVTIPLPAAWPTIEAVETAKAPTTLSILTEGQPLLRYHYTEVPFKPYAQEFFSPSGVNILRDAPSDHLHHHALMFALAVDKVDFWSELETCGHQVHRAFGDDRTGTHDGVSFVTFAEDLDWVAPKTDEVMLKEQRMIEVPDMRAAKVSFLTWQSKLGVPEGKAKVTLTGAHYFGLGMRFIESMDKNGTFFNSSGQPGEIVRGDERNVPANWCAYTAEADGKPVTVAMFSHPENPRHPTTWFTMLTPFSYLAATLNLLKEPLELPAGQPLVLRYGVALWDGRVEAAQIEELYAQWIKWPAPGI